MRLHHPHARNAVAAASATVIASLIAGCGGGSDDGAATDSGGSGTPPGSSAAAASLTLASIDYTDSANYTFRTLGGSSAQNTPAADGSTRYVERRERKVAGNLARWGSGADPVRNSDLSWDGSNWVACDINTENVSGARDAQGDANYEYCHRREVGRSNRTVLDVSGRTMSSVHADVLAGGFTNLVLADVAALGTAVYPAGSELLTFVNTPTTAAFGYQNTGAENPAGFGNAVSQYSAAVAGGGIASTQPANTACNNAAETNTNGTNSNTLEGMVAAKSGTPCIYGPGSFVYNGVTYNSGPTNDWWGNSTVSLGRLGTAPVNSGTAPGFFSGNTLLRIAFQGSGTNPVTYYSCQERFNNGSVRNCTAIGTGSYSIQALGDGRVMTFTNAPSQAAPLTYERVFVQRGGLVYHGYQSKTTVARNARLNTAAATSLLAQLGVTVPDTSVPWALTAGSYQGVWDVREAGTAAGPSNGTSVTLNANGTSSCFDRETATTDACVVTITDPATGTFTFVDAAGPARGSATGRFGFITNIVTGTFVDPSATPSTGSIVGGRR